MDLEEDESGTLHWGQDAAVSSEYDAMLAKVQRDLQQLSVGAYTPEGSALHQRHWQ